MNQDDLITQTKIALNAGIGGRRANFSWSEEVLILAIDETVRDIGKVRPIRSVTTVTAVAEQAEYLLASTVQQVRAVTVKGLTTFTLKPMFELDVRFDEQLVYDTTEIRPVQLKLSKVVMTRLSDGDEIAVLIEEDWPLPDETDNPNYAGEVSNVIIKGAVAAALRHRIVQRAAQGGKIEDEKWLIEAKEMAQEAYDAALNELDNRDTMAVIDLRPSHEYIY